jgi:hypothetical protein
MNENQVISDASVRPVSKPLRVVGLAFALGFASLSVVLVLLFGRAASSPLATHDLQILEWVLGFFCVYGIAMAAAIQYWRVPILARLKRRRSLIPQETTLWLMIHVLLYSPAIYGLLLYYCGMSLIGMLAYSGVAIALTLGWSIYDLRSH